MLRTTFVLPDIGRPPFAKLNQEASIPSGGVFPPFITGPGMDFPLVYRPHPASLTVDVIPSGPRAGEAVNSWTYTFSVAQPAPEPTSILLLGGGLSLMLGRLKLHKRPRE